MPTNLYGPNDNFDLTSSHVLPAMIRKFHEAKVNGIPEVTLWGDGSPMREFLYVDDMADACVYMMRNFNPTKAQNESGDMFLNIGTGSDVTIMELAETVKRIVDYQGDIVWDASKPNGTPRKLLDVGRLREIGWKYKVELEEGVRLAYEWKFGN
jgi:GDP-L-fucose synthase